MDEVSVDFNSNQYDDGNVVYIVTNAANISINDSMFTNNTSILGSVIYIDFQYSSGGYYYTRIANSVFDSNVADQSNI